MDTLPSYMMSVFPMPVSVSNSIDALRRNFLWQGSEDKKKFHLVKWKELMVSKNTRCQGIRILGTKPELNDEVVVEVCK